MWEGNVFPPARSAKLKIIHGLKVSKTSDLDTFYEDRRVGRGASMLPGSPPPLAIG